MGQALVSGEVALREEAVLAMCRMDVAVAGPYIPNIVERLRDDASEVGEVEESGDQSCT